MRVSDSSCSDCASVIHAGAGHYDVLLSGVLTCLSHASGEPATFNLTAGVIIDLGPYLFCENKNIILGRHGLRYREFTVTTTDVAGLDPLLLDREYANLNSSMLTSAKRGRQELEKKLKHEIASAREELLSLSSMSLVSPVYQRWHIAFTSAWVFILTAIFLAIVALIFYRVVKSRKARGLVSDDTIVC